MINIRKYNFPYLYKVFFKLKIAFLVFMRIYTFVDMDADENLAIFRIDIDGPNKGAGKNCIDYFTFYAYPKSGIRFSTWASNRVPNNPNIDSLSYSSVCAIWIIQHGNMDYLKLNSEGKCPDGKTILDGVSNITCK